MGSKNNKIGIIVLLKGDYNSNKKYLKLMRRQNEFYYTNWFIYPKLKDMFNIRIKSFRMVR